MTPAAIAAACGFMFSPPASWDAAPLPTGAIVEEIPFSALTALPCPPVRIRYGCTLGAVAYIPTWKTWPGTRACWLETRRHEEAHLKGWNHP